MEAVSRHIEHAAENSHPRDISGGNLPYVKEGDDSTILRNHRCWEPWLNLNVTC